MYQENITKELKKVFEVMHVVDTERVELASFQLKGIARTLFDQLKEGRDKRFTTRVLRLF